MKKKIKNIEEVFWKKVNKTNSCWLWIAAKQAQGYGTFNFNGRTVRAHKLSYEWSKGLVPKGLVLDHLCRNRICVNPDHLEIVSIKENLNRSNITISSINKLKTHCSNGHEFSKENTYLIPKAKGRDCKICRKLANIRSLEKRKIA